MFSSFTATAALAAAGDFSPTVTPIALIVVGSGVAIGLTGWVISRLRRAAR